MSSISIGTTLTATIRGALIGALFLAAALAHGCSEAAAAECPSIPVPVVAGAQKVCHAAYISLYDARLKVPRLVAYELTGPHTLGCVPRANGFHAEPPSARPGEYDGSGYDLGHMAPAQDNAWSEDASRDSFSMLNVAPQLPGLNREEWERLEESVRSWALQRGGLLIYVGPVIPRHPKMLGDIAIPTAFWKVVVDLKSGEVLAFRMPQRAIAKGDLQPWATTVEAIKKETGIKLSVNATGETLWNADITAWHQAHKAACGTEGER